MIEREYVEIKLLPRLSFRAKKIIVADLIECGVGISFFTKIKKTVGIFSQFENAISEKEEKKEGIDLTKEQIETINFILSVSIDNYSDEWLGQKLKRAYRFNNEEVENSIKIILFNQIIAHSNLMFSDNVEPDKNLMLACHFMAKNYGGTPWDYIEMPLDKYSFCLSCIQAGEKEEERIMRKLNRKK